MVEIVGEHDDVDVIVGGKSLGVMDAADDYVLAECDLQDLIGETAAKWPNGLVLQIHSSDGFQTYLFHELNVVANDEAVALDFVCHTYNKYWEGHYGLAVFLDTLRQ